MRVCAFHLVLEHESAVCDCIAWHRWKVMFTRALSVHAASLVSMALSATVHKAKLMLMYFARAYSFECLLVC